MVKIREPQSEKAMKALRATESKFINSSEQVSLSDLSLDELAIRFHQIDSQAQLLKGLILLEARERFKSNNEFGQWVVDVGLSADNRQNRNLFMNLAKFFKDRDMTGISLTAAYEISRPDNAEVAEDIYAYALNKNLKVAEVKRKIEIAKSITSNNNNEIKENTINSESAEIKKDEEIDVIKKIIAFVNSFESDANKKIELLEKSIQNIKHKLSGDNADSKNIDHMD
jgi:hypothetical protein